MRDALSWAWGWYTNEIVLPALVVVVGLGVIGVQKLLRR